MQQKQFVGGINQGSAEQAAGWFARLRSPECGSTERQAFEHWLAESEIHRQAYEAVARTAAGVSDALKNDARLRALLDADLAADGRARAPRGAWRRLSLAAAWVAAIGLAMLLAVPHVRQNDSPETRMSYANPDLSGRSIALSDGSTLHLDSGSEVTVVMSRDERRLTLVGGRAYFEVAKDVRRPFSVDAGGTRTVALGTKFEVRLQPGGVVVTLAEGSVSVAPAGSVAAWQTTLLPGEQLIVDAALERGEKRQVAAERVTAWSTGRLYFDGAPLRQVLADVNRYSGIKVVLGDEALGATPIGGNFAAGGDAGAFVQALSAILPLRSEPSGDHEIVLYPRERTAAAN